MPSGPEFLPIDHYAVIGDCRSAALVSRYGSIDWLCWPRYDSPSLFTALLDPARGGRFCISATRTEWVERRYIADTAVLETTFHTPTGILRLTDFMPIHTDADRRSHLMPERQILRRMECLAGSVDVEVWFEPRFDYGKVEAKLRERGQAGLFCEHGINALLLRSELPLQNTHGGARAEGRHRLTQGQVAHVSLVFSSGSMLVFPLLGERAERLLVHTVHWWRGWASQCHYRGPYREEVMRSALTLKLMCFAPSGAIIAAPTTSLPEKLGGVRNWDYRYCWLRDAAMTLRSLLSLGFVAEGKAFLAWMLHSTRLDWPRLHVLYDVHGERRLDEQVLDHLRGYADSKPVRIGNKAQEQLQLDVYGEVVLAAHDYLRSGGVLERRTLRQLRRLGETICKHWREPDQSIWEARIGTKHHTYSKMMCWVGLDCLVHLHQDGTLAGSSARFERERKSIRATIESEGFSGALNSYTSIFGDSAVDASLLRMAEFGYQRPDHPRMAGTYRYIRQTLGHNALLHRFRGSYDGLPAGEGAFTLCSFWEVEHLVELGDLEQARKLFETLLTMSNDVGLYSEELDAEHGAALGNFPQSYTHVGVINAALALAHAEKGEGG